MTLRRFIVVGGIGLSAILTASSAAALPASAHDHRDRHHGGYSVPQDSLRALGSRVGLRVGVAVNMDLLGTDKTYTRIVNQQFSSVTAENVMKWEAVEPTRGKYSWSAADRLVESARQNGQLVRGHTLVWHSQLPAWLNQSAPNMSSNQVRALLKKHVQDQARHFRGKIWQWDVVNEAFNEDGTLRDTIWLRTIGPDYIADAFRWAHQADPKAILFYNDYNVEGINAKSTAVYNLLRQLRRQHVPVGGFGAQGHLSTRYPFPQDILQNLRRFGRLGLATAITEADVRHDLPVDPAEVNAQAEGYSLMLESCLLERSCISYTVWGFTDRYQWVPGAFPGQGEAAIFDVNYNPKPAYNSMRRDLALAGNPGRRG